MLNKFLRKQAQQSKTPEETKDPNPKGENPSTGNKTNYGFAPEPYNHTHTGTNNTNFTP